MSFKTKISPKLVSLVFSILVICFAISFYIFAWTPPAGGPPSSNVPLPLNVSNNGQIKDAGLTLNYNNGDPNRALASTDALIIWHNYLQIDAVSGNPDPTNTDCDADSEAGRMILDYTNNLLYICTGVTGWRTVAL